MTQPRFTRRTERVLRRSGWQPGRQVALHYLADLEQAGWPVVPAALRFLEEFDGVTIRGPEFQVLGMRFGEKVIYARFGWVKMAASSDDLEDQAYAALARLRPSTPVGDRAHEDGVVYLIEDTGRVFGWMPLDPPAVPNRWLWQEAESADEFLERKC